MDETMAFAARFAEALPFQQCDIKKLMCQSLRKDLPKSF
jgi:hypothetical protein